MKLNSVRFKYPLFAALMLLGGAVCMSVLAYEPTAQASGWQEVNAADTAEHQLLAAPPRIAVGGGAQVQSRPPVEAPAEIFNSGSVYTVMPGDTLPKIAMKVYGDANKWQDLMVLNNIENGSRIVVGQRLIVANNNSSAPAAAQNAALPAENEVPEYVINETAAPSETFVSADAGYCDGESTYTVKRGDTLGAIAKKLLGSTQKWRDIARANPSINPNRLNVGDVLVMPTVDIPEGYEVAAAQTEARPMSSEPWQTAAALSAAEVMGVQPPLNNNMQGCAAEAVVENVSEPSFDQTPLLAPPPPPAYSMGSPYGSSPYAPPSPYGAPSPYGQSPYSPPAPQPPMYNTAPPPMPVVQPAPAVSPVPPVSSINAAPPTASVPPIVPSKSKKKAERKKRERSRAYREEKYRLPDELKTNDYSPYFVNYNGCYGLFEVESAMLPYLPTWYVGVQGKYEHIDRINGDKQTIKEGSSLVVPFNVLYTGKKFYASLSVPFQSWDVTSNTPGGAPAKAKVSGLANCAVKAGYQIWKNLEGTHAVTMHAAAKMGSENYQRPWFENTGGSGKTKSQSVMGPAGAAKEPEIQIGAAYSGVMNDRWSSHINLDIGQIPTDNISKFIIRGGIDYRVNRNFSLIGELNSTSYDTSRPNQAIYNDDIPTPGWIKQHGSGTTVDLVLGCSLFNEGWQGTLGFPISLQHDFGYGHDFGVMFGLNHRWN